MADFLLTPMVRLSMRLLGYPRLAALAWVLLVATGAHGANPFARVTRLLSRPQTVQQKILALKNKGKQPKEIVNSLELPRWRPG